jgi:hypothetical protein
VLVDVCQLDIGLGGVGNDEAVDDPLRDRLGHGMAQEILHLHGCAYHPCWVHPSDVGKHGLKDGL